jgi:hypothetical protein
MNINSPFPSTSKNAFQKIPSSVFTPTVPSTFFPQNISIYDSSPPNYINGWNKYQNLYNQIILHDKTALNIKKNNKPKTRYKTSLSKLKIIYNETSESNQTSNGDENDKNKCNEFLGKKIKREKNSKDIFEICKSTSTNNESFSNKKNRGRKKKDVIEKGNHTKFTDDNMMRKIKCHFFNHINNSLNNSLTDKKLSFLKLDNLINENLKKDYNMELMNKTIKDIYINSKISNKYKNRKNDSNKELVERIYLENKEIETIKILDKEYIELFTELMENKIDKFCNEILNKEEKNGLPHEQSSNFLDKMKILCIKYKDWFEKKRGRERKNFKV